MAAVQEGKNTLSDNTAEGNRQINDGGRTDWGRKNISCGVTYLASCLLTVTLITNLSQVIVGRKSLDNAAVGQLSTIMWGLLP